MSKPSLCSALSVVMLVAAPAHAAFAPLRPLPASTKYRDTSKPNAIGRSGSATITARALLSRTGSTELTVTTGVLDGASSGDVTKLQIKVASGTTNYTNLVDSGTVIETLSGLARGDQVAIQTNITGIDLDRTDVASLTETVKLRPNLAVFGLSQPSVALVNRLAMISAQVRELNGDVGARFDCTLSIDGKVVMTNAGAWVDAGDTVSCQFPYIFTQPGNRQIVVSAQNVVPWDDDPSNNSVSGTLPVAALDPSGPYDLAMLYLVAGSFSNTQWQADSVTVTGTPNGVLSQTDQHFLFQAGNVAEVSLTMAAKSALFQWPISVQYSETSGALPVLSDSGAGPANLLGQAYPIDNGLVGVTDVAPLGDPDANLVVFAFNIWVFDYASILANYEAGAWVPGVGFVAPMVAQPIYSGRQLSSARVGQSQTFMFSFSLNWTANLPDGTTQQGSSSLNQAFSSSQGVLPTTPLGDTYAVALKATDASAQTWGLSLVAPLGNFVSTSSDQGCYTYTFTGDGTVGPYSDMGGSGVNTTCYTDSSSGTFWSALILALPTEQDVNALYASFGLDLNSLVTWLEATLAAMAWLPYNPLQ
jgi:hypothetical protein